MACIGRRVSVFTCVLLLFSVVLLVSFPALSFAGGKVTEDVQFSLEVKDVALGRVFEEITGMTGYKILIDPRWEEISVSGSLKGVSLHEGLMRILNKYNAVISVDDAAKKCEVMIFERPGSIQDIPSLSKDKGLVARSKAYSADQAVVFPGKEGERGITVRELEAIIARQSGKDNGDLEVISPPEPGKKGITKKELETKIKRHSSAGPETLANFPPFLQRGIDGQGGIEGR
jgi:hypothetical protein